MNDELKAQIAKLEAALRYYADPQNWRSSNGKGGDVDDRIKDDFKDGWTGGSRAREALGIKPQEDL